MNEFGIGIFIRNIKRNTKQGYFSKEEEVNGAIDQGIKKLEACREEVVDAFREFSSCIHEEWLEPTYSVRRMILGYITVYERNCKSCGYCESVTVSEDQPNKPDWSEGAKQTYYNNDF